MTTRYEITIKETKTETKIVGKTWEKGANPESKDDDGYGYTPEIEKQQEVTRAIYVQNSEELDLKAVIKAINGI